MNSGHWLLAGWVVVGVGLSGCGAGGPAPAALSEPGPAEGPSAPVGRPAEAETPMPALGEGSGLGDYLAVAAWNNPGLRAAFERWKAALEQVPQVRALPDPRLTYRYFISEVETRLGAQRQGLGMAQRFPWFGKLSLRGEAAGEAARAEYERYQAAKLQLFYRVKEAYYESYYLRRAIETVEENLRLLKHIDQVVHTRYKAAAAGHPEVVRLQVELGKLDDRLRGLRGLRGPIAARLNAALGRPAEAEVPWPKEIENRPVSFTDTEVLGWLDASNPQLSALDHEAARAERRIELARKAYFPDVTVGLDWIDTAASTSGRHPSDDGKDALAATVSVNVPIWREKLAAGVRQARHRLRAVRRDRQEKANALAAEVKLALYRFRDAERKINLYRDTLLPKATESMKVTQVAFGAGKATFTDLIDAERIYLEFALGYERGLADRAQRLAGLEMLLGREIPRVGSNPSAPGG